MTNQTETTKPEAPTVAGGQVERVVMFHLTAKQRDDAIKWIKEHKCSKRGDYAGAIGGTATFSFTETGVGTIEVVKCWCGDELNLTDFSCW